ncbi:MAG: HAMP domain-containing protein [Firmicutes bacterium]|nr:HAMP domain-containing protein [Bacillota bacterium]
MLFRGLRWKITRSFLAVVLVTMILLSFAIYKTLETEMYRNLESRLASEVTLVRDIVKDDFINPRPSLELTQKTAGLEKELGVRITLIDTVGGVLADSEEPLSNLANHLSRPEVQQAGKEGLGVAKRFSSTQNRDTLYVAVPVVQGNQTLGFVRLAMPLTQIEAAAFQLWWASLLYVLGALVLIGLATHRIGRIVTDPINEMIAWARRMARGKFKREVSGVSLQRPDEIGDLGQALDHMGRRFNQLMQDITENRDKLEVVTTYTSSGIMVLDKDGKVALYNRSLNQMLGSESSMSTGLYPAVATRNYELSQFIMDATAAGEKRFKEMVILAPDEKILQVLVVPVGGERSAYVGALVVIYDITELRHLERVRTEFVANASHELRTPVAAIKGFAETLLEGAMEDPRTLREFLEIIHQESGRLERIILDLLQLAQIEARGEKIRSELVDLLPAVQEVLQKMKLHARDSGLTIDFEIPRNPVLVMANYDYVQQVLINLLENSISFTPSGGKVTIEIRETMEEVQVAVKDTGIGIPEEDLPRIFERFYLVDKSRSRKLGGTGLGLSIVRHMVEAMGGKVWVESQVGKGSSFYFTLIRGSAKSPDDEAHRQLTIGDPLITDK